MRRALLLLLVFFAFAAPARAVEPSEMLQDPKLEARARGLSANLRCLVCQNQSIDDSNAPLAKDLRLIVRERLKAGDTDRQVMDYLVARYGDFILLSPPLKAGTILLWGAPFAVLILGGLGILLLSRRRAAPQTAAAELSPEEVARLSEILDRKSP